MEKTEVEKKDFAVCSKAASVHVGASGLCPHPNVAKQTASRLSMMQFK